MLKRLALVLNVIGWFCMLSGVTIGIMAARHMPHGRGHSLLANLGTGAMIGVGIGVGSAFIWWLLAWIIKPRPGEDAVSGNRIGYRHEIEMQELRDQWQGRPAERVEPVVNVIMSAEELEARRNQGRR